MAAYATLPDHEEMLVASEQWAEFDRAYSGGHRAYVTDANKFSDFYNDEQWDPALRAKLEAEGKPVLTINIAKKTVNTVKGVWSNSRADIIFKPKKNATTEQAQALTYTTDHILESNDYEHLEAVVAMDGWVMDRGFFDVRMDFSDNVLGEVRIRTLDPRDVVLDPDAKDYDPSTWSDVKVIRWMSLDDIESEYGKNKAEKVKNYIGLYQSKGTFGSESVRFGSTPGETSSLVLPHGSKEQERRIRAVRVIESQVRKMGQVTEFVDVENGDTRDVPAHWPPERVRAVAEKYGLVVRKRVKPRIRWRVTVDHCVLHDEWSPYDMFTVVPYFPYFLRGRPTGVMRSLVSPQEQLNKAESQELHIINTTANSGWVVQAGSLVNMTNEELEERGAETGLVIVYGAQKDKPEKIQPNTIPTGIEHVAQKSLQYITDIPGVAPLAAPQLKSEVSGVAFTRASENALSTLRPVFTNLDYTRKLLGKVIVHLVQRYYTEARLFRITDWRHPEQPEIDVEINTDVVNNVTLGEYDIVATSAPSQDTQEDREFAQMIEMREAGVLTIPDYHVILASNIKNKQVIAEESKQLQGLGEPSEEEAAMQAELEQLQLEQLRGEVAKLQAEVEKLFADAQLSGAKAQVAVAAEEREATDMQLGHSMALHKTKADMAKAAANLMNKLELAGIHSANKNELTRYTSQIRALEKRLDRETQIQLAQLSAAEKRRSASGSNKTRESR